MEVALLNGLPPQQLWGSDARLNLCAVGQLASPLQSLWIGTQILRQLQTQLGCLVTVDPTTCLNELKHELFRQAMDMFPSMPSQPKTSIVKVCIEDEVDCVVTVHPDTTVANLLAAEAKLALSNPDGWSVLDMESRILLSPDDYVADKKVKIQHHHDAEIPDGQPIRAAPLELPSDEPLVGKSSFPCPLPDTSEVTPTNRAVSSLIPSALLVLPAKHLISLVAPQVNDPNLMEAMREQTMSVDDRLTILDHQEHVWGDDEILWHMSRCFHNSVIGRVQIIDPLLATGWLTSPSAEVIRSYLQTLPPFDFVATCILSKQHWTPVVWQVRAQELHAFVWDHEAYDFRTLEAFHLAFSCAVEASKHKVHVRTRDFASQHLCGAAAIAYLDHFVCKAVLPHKDSHLQAFHDSSRAQFVEHIKGQSLVYRPWCWGSGMSDLTGTLASLLGFHGVPEGVVQSRASLIVQSLGADGVSKALQGASPWKSLKTLANLHTPAIQLVLPDEQVAFRNRSSQPTKQKKSRKAMPHPIALKPADLDPSKLVLAEGSFCIQGDKPVPQISLSQVGPLSTGVALTNFASAHSFLKSGNLLTHHGLALLILNATEEPVTDLQWSSVRFAAKCSLNHEPILLTGFLVQLGKEPIYLFKNNNGIPLMQVDVACARVTVYKDQWAGSWEEFQTKPVKACMAHFRALHSCTVDECSCERWHPEPESKVHDAVLDVFRRQFFTEAGRPVEWAKADYFAFTIRYVQTQEPGVLMVSGKNGIYVEPKTDDAGSTSLKYQVVWLPQLSFEEVTHRSQCEALSWGVARSGHRYGVRVSVEHFQQVFQVLKPDGLFLPPGIRSSWHCGPWPFGVDRKAIAAVFKQWKWSARPLQPVHSVQGGMMWLIQAVAEPPQVVFHMQHGQVVISRCKNPEDPTVASEVIGQSQTVKLCANKCSEDPWLHKDPWQGYLPTTAPPIATQNPKVQIDQMEARLEKSILAKLPATPMEQDGHDERITILERQMAQIAGRQQSLEEAVHDHKSQSAAQVQQLQAQMSAQMDHQGRQMKSMFDDQMSKLEAILSKRSRHE